jgi:SAM-dependent methyltransferase
VARALVPAAPALLPALVPLASQRPRPWRDVARFLRHKPADPPTRRPRPSFEHEVAEDEFIGWVPTPIRVVRRMLELADIHPGETVYDLGCGDGRILIAAALMYNARCVGIDIDWNRIDDARRRAALLLDRITFQRKNVLKTNLRRADVIIIYLLPTIVAKLMPTLLRLKPGVRIVSHDFALPAVTPRKTVRMKGIDRQHHLFAYRTPLE